MASPTRDNMRTSHRRGWWIWIAPAATVTLLSLIWPVMTIEFLAEITSNSPAADSSSYAPLVPLFEAGLACAVFSAVVAIAAHCLPAWRDPVRERHIALLMKLGLVPFFIMGVVVITGATLFGFVLPPLLVVAPVYGTAIGYLVMLCGSAWGICGTLSLNRAGALDAKLAVPLIVLQFFFVLDVAAVLVLFGIGYRR